MLPAGRLVSQKYLYLDKLFEEVDLELCILVDEAKVHEATSEAAGDSSSYGAIVSDDTCRKYRIVFKNYAAYCVRDESYADWHNEVEFTGHLFRVYSKSAFLDLEINSPRGSRSLGVIGVRGDDLECYALVGLPNIMHYTGRFKPVAQSGGDGRIEFNCEAAQMSLTLNFIGLSVNLEYGVGSSIKGSFALLKA